MRFIPAEHHIFDAKWEVTFWLHDWKRKNRIAAAPDKKNFQDKGGWGQGTFILWTLSEHNTPSATTIDSELVGGWSEEKQGKTKREKLNGGEI